MISLIADTTSSIPPAVANELGIAYVPQVIIFGNESFKDDYELDTETFIKRLRASTELPKTAAPSPAFYTPYFEKFSANGDTIVVLVPSGDVSGTLRGATVGAEDFPNADIRIIDTRTVGSGLGSLVFKAHQWIKEGMDADTLVARIKEMASRQRVYFVVDTLEYLHKGGRIGGAKMLMGSLLQVKPILQVTDGHIEPFENQRTKRRAVARLKEIIADDCPRDGDAHLTIMHGDALEDANQFADELAAETGMPRPEIYNLPPAILVHAGPGVLAASFFIKAG
ncbi:MAG TPA: DegV family protein [Bellilinea sp.]